MTLGVVVLVVSVAPGIPRGSTRRVQQQQQQCVQSPHIDIYLPGIMRIQMYDTYELSVLTTDLKK